MSTATRSPQPRGSAARARRSSDPRARVWLDVPYAQKDAAKAAGARWDPHEKRWYAEPAGSPEEREAPRTGSSSAGPDMAALAGWMPLPELLPGEDRQFGSGLFVDLIPASCWFTNVRSCITGKDWDRVRRMVYARAGQRCEACGGQRDRDAKVWLEAHERWEYDEATSMQRLRRLVCLCTRCHESTHYGRATVYRYDGRALAHLMSVNRWSERTAQRHIEAAFDEWDRRNTRDWTLDLSMLTAAGVTLAGPPQARQHRTIANETLHGPAAAAATPTTRPEQTEPAAHESLSATVESAPGPGWFPDPAGRYEYRWWTGQAWTADVASSGVPALDPL